MERRGKREGTTLAGVGVWRFAWVLAAGLLGTVGGCKGAGGGSTAEPLRVDVVKAHREALALLPATTTVAVTFSPGHLSGALLGELDAMLGLAGADRAPVRSDLSALWVKRLGFDPTGLKTLTLFILGDQPAVGFLFPPGAEPPPATARSRSGWERAQRGGRFILVPRAMKKTLKSSGMSAAEAGHEAALAGSRGAPALVLTVAGPTVRALREGPLAAYTVDGAVLSVGADGVWRAAVRAPARVRESLLKAFDAAAAAGRAELTAARGALDALDPFAAAGVIYADHRFAAIETALRPHEDGDFLRIDLPTGGGGTSGLLLAGLSASMAIPAFVKYTNRAKTTEAIDSLDAMYKGAAVYFSTPHVDEEGNPLPCQFPASVGPTPKAGTCCAERGGPDQDGDGQCDPDPSAWSSPTWEALGFQITGPHRFVYAFESAGTGAAAAFTASAYGDLDCDGVISTFQRMGFGDPAAPPDACGLMSAPPPYIENEDE